MLSAFKSPFVMVMIFIIGILTCIFISTDKDGNPILEENEKEFLEFQAYKVGKGKKKIENPRKQENYQEKDFHYSEKGKSNYKQKQKKNSRNVSKNQAEQKRRKR